MHLASVLRVNAYRPKGGTRPADGEIDSFELIFAPPAGFAGFQFGRRIMTENTAVKVPISSVCGKGFPVTFNLLIEEGQFHVFLFFNLHLHLHLCSFIIIIRTTSLTDGA